ncbi:hypothetical protein BCV72DRAFT_330764 [Rhizopus microsporus var. microsporus]|uniref:Uncharacterized protein n=1 Tax=Rhizopus microsporus var. microsporus TaxID=86635 RepID=A0A1X0R0H6_RHIZD|nr:hypothetical protein BCV72DRAFT_330764 [Rhizopus microsporus var. microsporus]
MKKIRVLFDNIVRSDGFYIDFIFYRKTFGENGDDTLIQNHDLGADDFSIEEVTQLYTINFLDSGRKTVYTAAMDRLFTFYGFSTAKYRFNLYQGKQRAPEMMVNMLLNDSAKYNRKSVLKIRTKKKNEKKKGKNR